MQFRSSTPDLHNFYNSFLQKNRALNALSLLYCTPYTVHPTPRIKNIFYVFFFISRRAYIYVYLPPPARVRTLFTYTQSINAVRHLNSRQAIHAKPTRRQAIHCAYAYTRVARHIPKLTPIAATTHHQSDLCTDRPIRMVYHYRHHHRFLCGYVHDVLLRNKYPESLL